MNIDTETMSFLVNVVKTAQLVDIDNAIVEPGRVRGMDDNHTVVLFHEQDIPDMPFGSIGLNRLGVFLSRYEIARTQDSFKVEAKLSDDEQFARSLTLKGKGTKIDYRCANPTTIKAPRQINDTMKVGVQVNGEAVRLLQKGQAAMSNPETVTLLCDDDKVSFELVDVNNDVFKHTFAQEIELLDGDDSNFAHRYPLKILLSLAKQHPDGHFEIGHKGMLKFPVSDLTVYILPQV